MVAGNSTGPASSGRTTAAPSGWFLPLTGPISRGYSTVAIGWDTIYATGDVDGKLCLFAFGLDGKLRWRQVQDDAWAKPVPVARATPTLHEGKLYLMSGHGRVVCRNARDGKLIWQRRMSEFDGKVPTWGYTESVLVHDGKAVITPGGKQCIVALDKDTGRTVWVSRDINARAEYGSCIVVERKAVTMLVGVTKPGLVAVRADSGQKVWTNDYSRGGSVNVPTPLFADGHLFWPNGFDKGAICLRLGDDGIPTVAWTTDKDRECHLGDFIVDRGHLYGHHGGRWRCIELKTGEVKWAEKGIGNGSVCWADGMLYLFSESGGTAVLAVSTPEGFELRGYFRVEGKGRSWAHPVIAEGRLYLRDQDVLLCNDVRSDGRRK